MGRGLDHQFYCTSLETLVTFPSLPLCLSLTQNILRYLMVWHKLSILCCKNISSIIFVKWKQNPPMMKSVCCVHKTCVMPINKRQYWCFSRTYLLVRQVEQKLPVKASRPPECRVNRVKSVCSTNDHYLPTTVQAVHQGQQRGHNRTGQRKGGDDIRQYMIFVV